jgi:PAS domain S-box-containing protein
MNALVVNHDSHGFRQLQTLLEGHGFTVAGADNGVRALEALRSESFAVIISDVLMPGMDGFRLCGEVKADPALREIPFLFYTATHTSAADEALALRLGAAAYLIKPMEPADLVKAIRAALVHDVQFASPIFSSPTKAVESDDLDQDNGGMARRLERTLRRLTEADRERQRGEEIFHTLAQAAPCGIVRATPAGKLDMVNDRWCEISGVARENATVSSWQAVVHPEDRQRVIEEWQQAVAKGHELRSEFRLRKSDGSVTWVLVQACPVAGREGPSADYVATFTDVTLQKQLEQERAEFHAKMHQAHKLETIGTLVSGISHDFNNLVGAIFGYAEMARRQLAQVERASEDLKLLLSAAERAKALTGQILRFSRRQKEELKPIQVGPVVLEALALLRTSLPVNVRCLEIVAENLPQVLADATQLHQVVMNLVSNAVYALRETGGEVEVRVEALEVHPALVTLVPELEEGDYVVLSVRDTGRGIPTELLSQIFDPFFTTKPPGEGTGIGLAVVHDIVKSHGGAITVNSQEGLGATFSVYLPAMSQPGPIITAEGEGLTASRGPRVMYVDNEQLLASMVKRMLEMLGYRATVFTSSAEALEFVRTRPEECDLVISDMDMPGISGAALARRLLELRPRLPILFVTGVSKSITREAAMHLGARDVLLKPFDYRALGEAVANALSEGTAAKSV